MSVWIAHELGLEFLMDVAKDQDVGVLPLASAPFPGDPAEVEFWVPPFLATGENVRLVERLPAVKVIQLLSAGADAWTGRLRDGVTLCDARGVHDSSTAEWVMAAILTMVRRFDFYVRAQSERRWTYAESTPTDELAGKRVLVVGAGSIGAALAARLAPFDVEITNVARTARPDVFSTADLPELLPQVDIVVLLVPLTEQTRGLVDATFLASMRDGALLVNAARGPVADTVALTKELSTGRISAALDVTEPEPLPADHPLWTMSNVLITPHVGGSVRGLMPRAYRLVRAQLERYLNGRPLTNVVQDGY